MKGRQSEQDFISDLPDAILVHIFTFLPMEEVVKTGILSRRWDHLWTKVQRICYSSPLSGKREEMDKFTCFVNHTLSLLKCDSIQEFSLDFSDLSPEVVNAGRMEGMRRFALQVDRWIRWAVTKKVKVLYLNLADSKGPMYGFPYKVPGHIFSNDSITELLLCVCRLNPFRPIRWNNLKSLFLYDILLSDELIQNILSGTPLLEVIRLSECKGMRKVSITNPNLKGLALVCSSGPWIELSAPHVQTLEISGDMEQDRLKNVSSLLGGQVIPEGQTIDDSFQNLLRRTFESVRHAIVLGLSTRCLQVLSLLEQKMNVGSCSNCNRLKLNTCLTKWELPGIKLLLRSSPTLQTLTIQKGDKCGRFCFDDGVFPKYDFDEVNY